MNFNSHLEAVHAHEPTVKALVGWNEKIARNRAAQAGNGPLSGWALGVKDIIDVAGQPTLGGVNFLPATPKETHAEIVERLEALGAYVFAKTVTTSLAYFDPGPTTNPWNVKHTPGGSSSGSAAAVATGMVRFSLGSQTIGSIGRPAAYCGVVGFKPTYERMLSSGMIPFSPSVDTAGFFTNNMADLQTVCAALFNESFIPTPKSLKVGVIDVYQFLRGWRGLINKFVKGFRPPHFVTLKIFDPNRYRRFGFTETAVVSFESKMRHL